MQGLFSKGVYQISDWAFKEVVHDIYEVKMVMPLKVGDFTDFSSSINHAKNISVFRGTDSKLYPNFVHMPIAYQSRSSSIVVSGTDIHRPWGQYSVDKINP